MRSGRAFVLGSITGSQQRVLSKGVLGSNSQFKRIPLCCANSNREVCEGQIRKDIAAVIKASRGRWLSRGQKTQRYKGWVNFNIF